MANPFSPSPNDGAVKLLRAIFGPVIDTITGGVSAGSIGTPTMLSEAFRFFNSGVLLFGVLVLLIVTVMGVTNTANDGVALGKKWSTFYTPLRTLTAAATLIPSASGYAGIQIVMLIVVCSSIGFASNLWGAVVRFASGDDVAAQAISSVTNDAGFESVAVGALKMQVCAKALENAVNAFGIGQPITLSLNVERDPPSSSRTMWPGSSKPFLGTTLTYRTKVFYRDAKWVSSEDVCGRIVFSDTFDAPGTASASTTDVARSLQHAIALVRQRQIERLFQPNQPIALAAAKISAVAQGQESTFSSQIIRDALDISRSQFAAEITQEVSTTVKQGNGPVVERLTNGGWIYAGALFMELARIKDAVKNATTTQAEFIDGSTSLKGVLTGDFEHTASATFDTHMIILATAVKKAQSLPVANQVAGPTLPTMADSVTPADFADGGNGIKTMFTSWANRYSMSLITGMVHHLSEPDVNPVLKVKNLGDWLSSAASVALIAQARLGAALVGIKDGAAAESNQQVLGIPMGILAGYASTAAELLGKMWSYLAPLITAILYAGHYLGSWIPLVPFFVFSLGVVGWVLFVGEMLVACMLWMVAHLTPSSDDSFIGGQSQGYLLVASGFFRPALMILGFVFSAVVLGPVVEFVNTGFVLSVSATQADSLTGLVSVASFGICYCFLISAVFMMVFGLPQTFPDRILRWVGAGIGDMGEQQTMGRLENSASAQARTAAIGGAAHFAAQSKSERASRSTAELDATQSLAASLNASAPEGISGQSTALEPSEASQRPAGQKPDPTPEL